jgi:hypothetical protein
MREPDFAKSTLRQVIEHSTLAMRAWTYQAQAQRVGFTPVCIAITAFSLPRHAFHYYSFIASYQLLCIIFTQPVARLKHSSDLLIAHPESSTCKTPRSQLVVPLCSTSAHRKAP